MSTSTTSSISFSNTTDAAFRAWGLAIRNAILAVGLTRTSDTGQIDFTTVLAPTVSNTSRGYDIFQFTDSLQSTTPVYLKFEYGSGPGLNLHAGFFYTVGTSTDGAGTLTGTVTARAGIDWGTSNTSYTGSCYACSNGGGSLYLIVGDQTVTVAQNNIFFIDRLRTFANVATSLGVLCYASSAGVTGTPRLLYFSANQSNTGAAVDIWTSPNSAINIVATASDVCLFPPVIYLGQSYSVEAFVMKSGDATRYSQFTATVLGVSKNLIVGGPGVVGPTPSDVLAIPFQ